MTRVGAGLAQNSATIRMCFPDAVTIDEFEGYTTGPPETKQNKIIRSLNTDKNYDYNYCFNRETEKIVSKFEKKRGSIPCI